MRRTDFFALLCAIWLTGGAAASHPVTKLVFLGLGIFYLILQITTVKNDD
jgi:hypothetical protein